MIKWNADLYDNKHSFIAKYGEDLLSWLDARENETILDLGCGTGQLTHEITKSGATVTGMDASAEMIEKATAAYPGTKFFVGDATGFETSQQYDAVFSNATLHWINDQDAALTAVNKALKAGGRFVLEMGGKNNIKSIADAVVTTLQEKKLLEGQPFQFWYFPSVAAYTTLLEQHGFTVESVLYFNRPTPLTGEDGMKNWIDMFGSFLFKNIDAAKAATVTQEAVAKLKPTNYNNGTWYADYVRLRIKAIKN